MSLSLLLFLVWNLWLTILGWNNLHLGLWFGFGRGTRLLLVYLNWFNHCRIIIWDRFKSPAVPANLRVFLHLGIYRLFYFRTFIFSLPVILLIFLLILDILELLAEIKIFFLLLLGGWIRLALSPWSCNILRRRGLWLLLRNRFHLIFVITELRFEDRVVFLLFVIYWYHLQLGSFLWTFSRSISHHFDLLANI